MKAQRIAFTKVNHAELEPVERICTPDGVMVKTEISTISCGTEKANITGNENVNASGAASVVFPRYSGYSSSGIVIETGSDVKDIKVGDRVVCYWGNHSDINMQPESKIVKIEDENVSFEDAAISFIGTFPLAAIRKTRLEIGESALVMGLGILGQLAVKLLRAAGATPIIAADPVEGRREEALKYGADYAFDPTAPDFAEKVKEVTGGGVNVAIEVSGVGAGLDGALDCMKRFGRVALLGCTRDKNFTIDYYRKVHGPGISLIGAHTIARPDFESHPGYFTHNDDIKAILKLCATGRITLSDMVSKTFSPNECTEVYNELITNKNFPTIAQFDWSKFSEEDK